MKKNRVELHFTDDELKNIDESAKLTERNRKNFCESGVRRYCLEVLGEKILTGTVKKSHHKKKVLLILFLFSFASCGTVLGGRIDTCQKQKPDSGARAIRPAAFIADLLIWPPFLIVDFCTGAIYKPCKNLKP